MPPVRVLPIGGGYASTSVNLSTFRHHALVTQAGCQFAAFYVSSAEIRIVRRRLSDDAIEVGTLSGSFNVADVHNAISLGVDSNGFVHIAYDHHCDALRYRRTRRPLDVTDWTDPLPMTGRLEDCVTYPMFLMGSGGARAARAGGRLLFLYRHGYAGNGDMCLKEYDPDAQAWTDLAERFVKGMDQHPWTSNAYWNHPAFDSRGNLLLSWVWRVVQKASANGDFIFNHNHGFARSPDGRGWFTSHGVALTLPMTQVNSEVIWPTPPGATIANMCSSAADSRDRLHIATYGAQAPDAGPQYQHIWFDGSTWRCGTLTRREGKFGLLTWDAPMSTPEILIDRDDIVYVIYRCDITGNRLVAQRLDPPDYQPAESVCRLWHEDMGDSEPVVDRVRWAREGVLSMLLQRTTQPQLMADRDAARVEPVRIADWTPFPGPR